MGFVTFTNSQAVFAEKPSNPAADLPRSIAPLFAEIGTGQYKRSANTAGFDFNISPLSGIAPLTVKLNANKSSLPADNVEFHWLASNGQSTVGSSTDLTFELPGSYPITVSMIKEGETIAWDSKVVEVHQNNLPIAFIDINPKLLSGTKPHTVTMNGSKSADPLDGQIIGYEWITNTGLRFPTEEGRYSESPILPMTFEQTGIHTVTLIVYDENGGASTASVDIQVDVLDNPLAFFTVTPGKAVLEIDLDASVSDENDSVIRYEWQIWQIQDPELTLKNYRTDEPTLNSIKLPISGNYRIQLIVVADDGKTATMQQNIYVGGTEKPVAIANVMPLFGLEPLEVELKGEESYDPDGTVKFYHWSLNGQNISASPNLSLTLPAGNHHVALTVTDVDGLTDTAHRKITVKAEKTEEENNPPTAIFTVSPDSGFSPLTVTLDGRQSNDIDGDAISYEWSSLDGDVTSSDSQAAMKFRTVGKHHIFLKVSDGELSQTTQQTVEVIKRPEDFSVFPQSGCAPLTVILETEFYPDLDYMWTYNGTFTSNRGQPVTPTDHMTTMTFTEADTYTVTLKATDNQGPPKVSRKKLLYLNCVIVIRFRQLMN
ncbi:MAG: hypothetical protein DRR19_32285 [Candidatus Parabeggiatoa sp. nov. 1]|nr:MAG: hypothetical protein DRR19_32285 [Gammaproteobacteria bacterium]